MTNELTIAPAPTDWIRRAIAAVLIAGGAFGLFVAALMIFGSLLGFVCALLYVLSVVGGIGLWRQTAPGERIARISLLSQVPWIIAPKFGYVLACGVGLFAGFGSRGLSTQRSVGSSFEIRIESGFGPQFDTRPWLVGVNYFALAALIYLLATASRHFQEFQSDRNS